MPVWRLAVYSLYKESVAKKKSFCTYMITVNHSQTQVTIMAVQIVVHLD